MKRFALTHRAVFNRACCMAAIALLLTATGCGGKYDSYVSGTVTVGGQGLERGTIVFNPVSAGANAAFGSIQADGSYVIKSGLEEGLSPGEYIVTITSRELTQRPPGGGPPPQGKSLIALKYKDQATSGLNRTVESGKQTMDFDLEAGP